MGAGLCKSQHNALANCFARLRFLEDGKEKPSNRHYIKLKNFAFCLKLPVSVDSEDVGNVGIKENETVDLEVVFRLTQTH